jgi:hypothetical protein
MFTKDARFADKTKIRSCETKKIKVADLCISCEYEWFSQAHNHEHDANGNHSDHNESTAHTRVAPTAKQLDSLLNKFKVKKSMLQNLVV